MAKLWNEHTLKGEDLARAQREIASAMRGVVSDALSGRMALGRGVLPQEDRVGGEPSRNGIPVRVLEQIEAAEKARAEQAKLQTEWDNFQQAKALEPKLGWSEWEKRQAAKRK